MSHSHREPRSLMRKAGALMYRAPFTTWAICALAGCVSLESIGVSYDSFPLGLLIITDGVWAWMYWIPSELLFTLNGGVAIPGHVAVSVGLGVLMCFLADSMLCMWRSRKKRVVDT